MKNKGIKEKNFQKNGYYGILVIAILIIIVIIMLFFSIWKKLNSKMDMADYPASTLKNIATEFEDDEVSQMLPLKIACPSLEFQIYLPEGISSVEEKITGSLEDIDFVIYESAEGMDKMIESILPNALNFTILGSPHDVNVKVREEGYFYSYAAEYASMCVTTKISVREITTYAVVYRLALSGETSLYIYVSTESKELLESAKILLDEIAYSVRPIIKNEITQDAIEGKPDLDQPNLEQKDVLNIYLEKESLFAFENGVFLFEWMNVDVSPKELTVTAPDGTKLSLMNEYSSKGHYVYSVGEMESGTYIIEGITSAQITGVVMSIYEWDYYYEEFVTYGFD